MKTRIKNCGIRHIETRVPSKTVENIALDFDEKLKKRIIKNTGVKERHVLEEGESLEEMYLDAGLHTLQTLSWEKESVDGIIVVTQTPEYRLPATSAILQGKLGLSTECFAYDVAMGCSGYVYGLYNAMSNLAASAGEVKRVLLFVGDAISTLVHPQNKSNVFLFGDAVSCTALEYDQNALEVPFVLKTDGREYDSIIVPEGGLKTPLSCESFDSYTDEEGVVNSRSSLDMQGAKVFNFTVGYVPLLVEEMLTYADVKKEEVEHFFLHQANKFMIRFLSDKIGISSHTPINIETYGNTSCTSIPLLLTEVKPSKERNLLVGFGVGMSMGSCVIDFHSVSFHHEVYKGER